MRILSNECLRELRLERYNALQIFDLFRAELDLESLDVILEMLDFSTSNDGKDVWCFRHDIRKRDRCDRLDIVLFRNLFQCLADFNVFFALS